MTSVAKAWLPDVDRRPLFLFGLGVLLGFFALWYAVDSFDLLAIGAVAGGLSVLVIFRWPFFGMLALVTSIPIEALVTGDGAIPTVKGLALLVVASWALSYFLWAADWRLRLPVGLSSPTLLLLMLAGTSSIWAIYPNDSLKGVFSLGQLVLLSVILADMATDWKRVRYIVTAILFGGLVAAGTTVMQFYVLGVKRAGDGVSGGINGTAAVLVSILPLALYAAAAEKNILARGLGLAYLLLAPMAVLVTFSRSAWLLMGALLTMSLVRWMRSSGLRGVVACSGIAVAAISLAPKTEVVDRASSIVPIVKSYVSGSESGRSDSREYHYEVGKEMFRDAPMWGIGYNNYPRAFRFVYQFKVPGAAQFYSSLRSPHSTYVGLVAELGLLGMVLWAAVLAAAIGVLFRAKYYLTATPGMGSKLTLRNALLAAIVLQAGFCISTTVHLTKIFWVLTGLVGVFGALSRTTYGKFAVSGRVE